MKGVAFDLDGVITDTAKFHFEAWSKLALEKFDLELPAEFESQLKGISRIESLERILAFGKLSGKYTPAQVAELADEKNTYYVAAISKLTQADILPGISQLLADLKAQQVKLSLASASKNAPMILEKLGLLTYFDAIVDPSKLKAGKPAPDIFIEAAKAVGLAPSECVGLEDASAGVASIKAAGMVAVAIGDKEELAQADTVVSSTADLNYDLLVTSYQQAQGK